MAAMKYYSPARFAQVLLYFSLVFLVACASQPSTSQAFQKGLLWKVEAQQLATESYLLGTIHSEDPRVANLEGPAKEAFEQAKIFALEVELDPESSQTIIAYMYYDNKRSLRDVLSKSLYERSVKAMTERGMPETQVARMKPWAIFMVLNMPEATTGEFLDAILYQSAKQQKKSVHGLESIEEQINVFDQMALATQVSLLKATLDNQADMDKMLEETIEVYLSRDLTEIEALNAKYLTFLETDVADIFTQRLLIERNERMVQRLIPLMQQGKTFAAVGALHLPGEHGILELLAERGYKLTPVY